MTLLKRVIVCLDVDRGRVVKGTRFVSLRDMGDPVVLARKYETEGADEIVFLDIGATPGARDTTLEIVRRTAEALFIPLTVGGGIRSANDIAWALRAGADKVAVNTAAVERPELIAEASARFGAQCVVASIDAKMRPTNGWEVYTGGGRRATGIDAVEWARKAAALGAGEILLTSIDRDGVRSGFDVPLLKAVSGVVDIPVIASGGAGNSADVVTAFQSGGVDAALVAGIIHEGLVTVGEIKSAMECAHLRVRRAA